MSLVILRHWRAIRCGGQIEEKGEVWRLTVRAVLFQSDYPLT